MFILILNLPVLMPGIQRLMFSNCIAFPIAALAQYQWQTKRVGCISIAFTPATLGLVYVKGEKGSVHAETSVVF